MEHPNVLLPDYALGLLDPAETAAVEAHLRTCETCREEVRQLDLTLTSWADARPEVAAPPHAKADLMNRIRSAKPVRAAPVIILETPHTEPEPTVDAVNPERAVPTIIRFPRAVRWLSAACIACLFIAGSSLWQGYRAQLGLRQLRAEQGLITRFLGVPGAQTVTLYNSDDQALGTALVHSGEALFVLAKAPPSGRTYQAWGHTSDDWSPQSGEQLTSLAVSREGVFSVSTTGFASLYLSLEPPGGSPQPTDPLSRVTLTTPATQNIIEVSSPVDGTVVPASVIVRGKVASSVRELRYRLGSGRTTQAPISSNRFIFTLSGLQPGENSLELLATTATGQVISKRLTLRYVPGETAAHPGKLLGKS